MDPKTSKKATLEESMGDILQEPIELILTAMEDIKYTMHKTLKYTREPLENTILLLLKALAIIEGSMKSINDEKEMIKEAAEDAKESMGEVKETYMEELAITLFAQGYSKSRTKKISGLSKEKISILKSSPPYTGKFIHREYF